MADVKPTAQKKPRTTSWPGYVNKHVHIDEASWKKILAFLDQNCLDEGKWLSRQFEQIAAKLNVTEKLPFPEA